MKQTPDDQPLALNSPENVPQARIIYIRPGGPQPTAAQLEACEAVVLVSEPFWMQDVRLAQRRLDAARLASRPTRPDRQDSASELGDQK